MFDNGWVSLEILPLYCYNYKIDINHKGVSMKKLLLCLLGAILLLSGCASLSTRTTESGIQIIPSFDEYPIEGMLAMPEGNTAETLVIYVNGSGPNTYDNKRQLDENRKFTYFDLFREEFTKRGIAFFSYNTRGVTTSDEPPYFTYVDDELYKQYIPTDKCERCG